DGWSFDVLLRELDALHGALSRGEPSPLSELPVQYADFAVWQRGWLAGDALERQVAFWRERLAGAPPLLELATDRPRPQSAGGRRATHSFALPAGVAEELRALSRASGATLFMTALAGFQALLARWSGQDDVLVGTPVAGRRWAELEGLIGFFVNNLVVRTELSRDTTGWELVRQLRERMLEAQAHQDLPFERLVEALSVERSLSHTPLFQVTFSLESARGRHRPRLGGAEVETLWAREGETAFDLALVLVEDDDGLAGEVGFREELFEASTVARMMEHFRALLEGIAREPGRRLAELELLTPAERGRLLEWSTPGAGAWDGSPVHEMVAEQARRTPFATAVEWEGGSLAYAELEIRANRLARHLLRLGVGPGSRVGVCMERSPELVVALLGTLRAAGAYVPLDPGYPVERLAYMVGDAAPAVLLTQERLLDRLPGGAAAVVALDGDVAELARGSAEPPAVEVSPDDLAYVIYTSGSTGRPKGVAVPHRALANHVRWMQDALSLGPDDRVLQKTPTSFDASVWEFWAPLVAGATLVLARPDGHRDPAYLAEALAGEGITVLQAVPSLLSALLEEDLSGAASLRRLFCGGEALPAELARTARERTGAELYNLYGPTEACIDTTWARYDGEGGGSGVPIGRPITGARVHVLDAEANPAPIGVPGELCVGGEGLARGYLGRPELTAERFVPDPFSPEAGGRLYRTGDRARWLASGELEFLGRIDQQVKLRGFRIEPGEIEAALLGEPGVREAAVVVREDAPGDPRLVGYVVPAAGATLPAAELREGLRRRLPEHMVPGAVVVLDALPLTPAGKLDRRALPAPAGAGEEGYAAPRTPTEEVVAGIFAEVLGAERVGAQDNFFELGGHSLLATRVVARVAPALGIELPLRVLFEAQTVAGLAARIDAARLEGEGGDALPPLVRVDRSGPLPLSFAQERLWFLHAMEPDEVGYNMAFPSRLTGRLDTRVLERALGALVERHESLRTVFHPVARGAVQTVHPAAPGRLPTVDLGSLPAEAREREARRLAQADAGRAFDLERGPVLRTALVRLSGEEHVLLLTVHHVVSDGWSMGVLFRDLYTLYDAFSRGASSPLAPLPVQYADFAVWQRGWLRGAALRRQLGWWRERLGGSPPALELPTDRPRPAVVSGRGASHRFPVPAETAVALRALARREGATLYMVGRAAADLLLSRWSGQEDVVVGSPIANRTRVELDGVIGFFVNTLALRTDLSGDPTFAELLGRVRETALSAYAHQDLPFERLVEEVAPERSLSHTPLFQVMFALQNLQGAEAPPLVELRVEPFPMETRAALFDLELELWEHGEELAGGVRFRTDLFDAATVERFAAQYRTVLAAVSASPEERLSRVSVLPEEEERHLLAFGSGSARDTTGDAPVHRLFAAQAARTPDAVAVVFEGGSLTYAELDARASALAARLRAGTTVAVCVERGPQVVVGLLAAWKAGAVYLPLDPTYPAERLSFLLRDSGAETVLTESHLVLPEVAGEVVLIDGPAGETSADSVAVSPDDLAYLIYTSGSTGTPKAVMVEHRQLAHTLRGALGVLGFGPGDVVSSLASVAFDISLLELVGPLLAGAAVRIVPRERLRDPEELVDSCADVTVLHAVPALMRQVVEAARGGRMLPGLRLLLVGGDAVPPDLLEEMRGVFAGAETRVLYGPTEGTIICATYAVPREGAVEGHPLGRPLPGVRLRVCGPRGEAAPVGVPGEIWISGPGVTRGYLGRPDLTKEKFVDVDGERAYRTGDRALWRPDGTLEFLGRTDEQVKVRGFRIEPGEVEAVLREQPGVRETVVLAREDRPGEKRLVAYVVPGADAEVVAATGEAQVADWETIFDDTYALETDEDPTLRLTGWNSSYTGEPIPQEEMREWVDRTVERIL
ncbi:MAG TPA: amino acid adenylation domain-containing protein, partial [Longimicrobiaceae bacterium]